jgi:DNA-binding XRE family transcriptional regulator/desulfoferrodoxin (superoxide reductase-like protein)
MQIMDNYVTGNTIRALRERKGFTQKQLADKLEVSAKTISKWETGCGLPDISLLEPLAQNLGTSLSALFTGQYIVNSNTCYNMLRGAFYVCPVCGNVIYSAGESSISCCGITLPRLEAEAPDDSHDIYVKQIEYDFYITLEHQMTKKHYISFMAYVTQNKVNILKLYPEQDAEGRFPMTGDGKIFIYCNRHGLFTINVK